MIVTVIQCDGSHKTGLLTVDWHVLLGSEKKKSQQEKKQAWQVGW
jgi:hypothetical protein